MGLFKGVEGNDDFCVVDEVLDVGGFRVKVMEFDLVDGEVVGYSVLLFA